MDALVTGNVERYGRSGDRVYVERYGCSGDRVYVERYGRSGDRVFRAVWTLW